MHVFAIDPSSCALPMTFFGFSPTNNTGPPRPPPQARGRNGSHVRPRGREGRAGGRGRVPPGAYVFIHVYMYIEREMVVGGYAFHQVRILYIYVCAGIDRVTKQITERIIPSYNDDIDRGCRAGSAGG